jgi:hypothetical protein
MVAWQPHNKPHDFDFISYICGMKKRDKEKQKEYSKQHYLRNKGEIKKRSLQHNKETRTRNREFVNNYLLSHPCVDCGVKDIVVLEFDHVKGVKENAVAVASNRSWSLDKLKKEIEKCEVRCANCHRRVTHKRRG